MVWTFHTIPHPGEFGYETWPKDAWKKVGGANVWSELTLDEKRGILYAPTASAKYNFYGVDRTGANLFADCLLALDARTGKRLWHFQMVHHDIWDYDDPTAPKLLTLHQNGKTIDVVAQVSKQGFVWVFNRVTGEPIWPIEERPVPKSDMPGETTWPTQPFPTKPPPYARQKFTVDDLSPYLSPWIDRAKFRDQILSARNEGLFTPPAKRGTIQMPGNNGGANWGGAAVDPAKGVLVVVSKDLPSLLKLEADRRDEDRYLSGFGFMIASDGLSAIKPPWTSLTAYDLNEGTIKWKIASGRRAGEEPEGHRRALSESRAGDHRRRVAVHRHARSESPRVRRRNRKASLGSRGRRGAGRDARGLSGRRPGVHRLLRGRAGGSHSGDAAADSGGLRGVRAAPAVRSWQGMALPHERQPPRDRRKLVARLHALRSEAVLEDPAHRRDQRRSSGQKHPIHLRRPASLASRSNSSTQSEICESCGSIQSSKSARRTVCLMETHGSS